jgi:hypothetical protein
MSPAMLTYDPLLLQLLDLPDDLGLPLRQELPHRLEAIDALLELRYIA